MAKNGVDYYTKAFATIEIYFPNGEITCHRCTWCSEQDTLKRCRCRLTNELIFYPMSGVGDKCPAVVIETVEKPIVEPKEFEEVI